MNVRRRKQSLTVVGLFMALIPLAGRANAQSGTDQGYRMPPGEIAALIDAPPTPGVNLSPDRQWLLLMERPSLPSIAEVSQPELRLAGMRINPRTNGPSRRGYLTGLTLKNIGDSSEKPIVDLPDDARIGSARFSPDSRFIAFTITERSGISLWVAEVETARARRLTEAKLNAVAGSAYSWLSDSRTLICRMRTVAPAERPSAPTVPSGPVLQENIGRRAPVRTYQDLLKSPHDKALFESLLKCDVLRVGVDGKQTVIGSGLVSRVSPAPDGNHLLVEVIHRPFSYLVPAYRFPRRVEIWSASGKVVKLLADLPLREEVPIGFDSVPTGPRSFSWRADAAATVVWAEAQDGGDSKAEAEIRDRVFALAAPFESQATLLASLGLRYAGITWGHDQLALVTERWWKSRRRRTWIVEPSDPAADPKLLFDLSWEDRYNDPGSPLMRVTKWGTTVMLSAEGGKTIYLGGQGASREGDRPFVDRFDLATKKADRLWRSQPPQYESPVAVLDAEKMTLLTRRESKVEPPNYFVRELGAGDEAPRQLTRIPHPTPQLANVHKELIRYQRLDGVQLTATLYLPVGYKPADGPLPMVMWAYPREFKSASAAGQVRGSPHRFVRVSSLSPLLWLSRGYAVLDNPTLPIIGEGDTQPNDSYVRQLVAGARAAVDEVVRRGVADRERIAIGGHSYGAFMAANLLAHSDLFRAGIARSGAYNRTLTPFGFQAEERTYWETPEVYFAMSPFMHAPKVNEPLLLIHGEADNNSGTFPLQSRRYYHALKGHGATARLVMLPHESHGYRARESVMHVAWETSEWLDRYVKNAPPHEPDSKSRQLRERAEEPK